MFAVLILLCTLIAWAAEKTGHVVFVWIVILALSFVAGLRDVTVGLDTANYARNFDAIAYGYPQYAYGFEPSFRLICGILLKLCGSKTALFVLFSILTNALILLRFWDFRHMGSFPWMVADYFFVFYFFGFNILRQMCAVAIVFWATRWLQRRKYFTYLFFVLVAYFFHHSAILGVLAFGVEFVQWKALTRKQQKLILASIFLIPAVILYLPRVLNEYQDYLETPRFNIGFMVLAKLVLFAVSAVGLKRCVTEPLEGIEGFDLRETETSVASVEIFYLVGLLFTALEYVFSFMNRAGLYFYLYECVYYGMITGRARGHNKVIYRVGIGLIFAYSYLLLLFEKGQGVFPYAFVH